MTHLESIIKACEIKNVKVEQGDGKIGFRLPGKNVYHWFYIHERFLNFIQSYSQNTGVTKTGLWHGIRTRKSISKKLGIEL